MGYPGATSTTPNVIMKIQKTINALTAVLLAAGLSISVSGQMPGGQESPDQVAQLVQMLDLSEEQEADIRGLLDDLSPQIDDLHAEAQTLQERLQEQAGADFDEEAIREIAGELGEVSGEITALSIILQSKVEAVFTAEQRQRLEDIERQQREMQEQMMQQQMQQQPPQGAPPQETPGAPPAPAPQP